MKIIRRVHLKGYTNIDSRIKICHDLPWPEFIIHDNAVFRYDRINIGGVGQYTRDGSFYNTLPE